MAIISPSILSCDLLTFKDLLPQLKSCGVDMLHFDVMDGNFVPNISFGVPVIKSIRKHTDISIDTHLMIDAPHRYIEEFAKYSDWLGFHYEAGSDCLQTLKRIKELGVKATITIKPNTAAEEIFHLLPFCDMVLVMSVEPGFGGQKFIESSLEKISALKEERERQGLDFLIEIDGGINSQTALLAVNAGVDVLVAGSFVFDSENILEKIAELKAL